MKSKFLFFAILIAGLLVMNLSLNQVYGQTPPNKSIKQSPVKCTCLDHPDVTKDHLSKCSKCGMTLIEKKGIKKVVNQQMKDSTREKLTPNDMKPDTKHNQKDQMKKETTPPIKKELMEKPIRIIKFFPEKRV